MKRLSLSFLAALSLSGIAPADVSLPALFSDHMVLQRDRTAPVWGRAEPSEPVSVSIAGQTKTTTAGADGKWRVNLDKLQTSEPTTLTVKGKNTLTIQDVLAGEVWLCSGQSNMGFAVGKSSTYEQAKTAADLPKVRVFRVASGGADEPQEKCTGQWIVCTPATVGSFSAAAFFFGREIHTRLGVPVGLIHSAVGGTPVEAWTSLQAQRNVPEVKPIFESWEKKFAQWDPEKAKAQNEKLKASHDAAVERAKAAGKAVPKFRPIADPKTDVHRPVSLFNAMIAPLIPYAIRGAIWYQGENNAHNVEGGLAYRKQLPLLVEDWRKRWGYEFPFAWVQLPELERGDSQGWCLVREAMLKSLKLPHTGMAVALGLGDAHNIHPTRKEEVGQRLAAWALADVYGQKVASSGPLYAAHKIAGDKVTISFTHTDGGLVAKEGDLKGFVIAGEDKQWKPATAKIDDAKIVVSSPEVKAPVAVRYAWKDNPEFNLYNGAGLPASPFRTDDWPIAETAPVRKQSP